MNKIFKWLYHLLSLSVLLFTFGIQAQQNNIPPVLTAKLENLSKNFNHEEVYIQTDKSIYETSENLWFKGYIVNSSYFTPSIKSKTLYVSLLKMPDRKAVWEEKYAAENGFIDGHIYINDTLQAGEYLLVAQTKYSINADEEYIKSVRKIEVIKNINDIGHKNQPTEQLPIKNEIIDFQILPEGGQLVAGIMNKVAFKAVDNNGNPVDVKAGLYTGSERITTFVSVHAGMGYFFVNPSAGENYKVKIDGYTKMYQLPEIKTSGVVLQMVYNKDNIIALKAVQTSNLTPQKMYIRLQIRGVTYSLAEFELKTEKLIKIQTDKIPQGIAEVTLFNNELQPVAERLVFVNEEKQLFIKATVDKTKYKTKEKVKIKLQCDDAEGNPISAHLGVSVTDVIYSDDGEDQQTIVSFFQLSSQLKGKLSNPGYYFNPKYKDRKQALDLLLLTQGWRSYQWSEANLKQQKPKVYPIEDTLTGSIYVKKNKPDKLLPHYYIMGFLGSNESNKTLIETNDKGEYTILPENLHYDQRGFVYFRLISDKTNVKINPIKDRWPEYLNNAIAEKGFIYPLTGTAKKTIVTEERLKINENVNQLDEIVLNTKIKKVHRFSDKFMGSLDSIAKFERNTDYVCINGTLNCPIPAHRAGAKAPVEGEIYSKAENFKDVGLSGGYWLVVSSDKHAPYSFHHYTENELLDKFNMARIKGYYPHKEFYNPVYDIDTIDNAPDFRNTLFWKPDVITDINGQAEIEFYTSDINSKFRVVVEGINGDGLIGNTVSEIKVEQTSNR